MAKIKKIKNYYLFPKNSKIFQNSKTTQVVVITDGKSKDDIKTPGRALKKLAHVMAIGVGVKVRTKDLYEIATADEYIYTPESYAELEKLKYEVADKHCPPGCV